MTPQFPKPSAHDVVTGFFVPNNRDTNLNAGNNFGTTIPIMAQDNLEGPTDECMDGRKESYQASVRMKLYSMLLFLFADMSQESNLSCISTYLDYGGSGEQLSHWSKNSKRPNTCILVNYVTQYSVYDADDYKRCVCDSWGSGASDCP